MDPAPRSEEQLQRLLEIVAHEGMSRAAQGLSAMVGHALAIGKPTVHIVRWADLPDLLGGAEAEGVGIYLQVTGDLEGQIILVMPVAKAMELADLVLEKPVGETVDLGSMERSALREVGNLTGTFFLNAMAALTGLHARPSPPVLMLDMLGAILDVVVCSQGGTGDHALLLDASFLRDGREVEARMCVLPNAEALDLILRRTQRDGHA